MGATCRLVRSSSWDTRTEVTTFDTANFTGAIDSFIFCPCFCSYMCAFFANHLPPHLNFSSFIYFLHPEGYLSYAIHPSIHSALLALSVHWHRRVSSWWVGGWVGETIVVWYIIHSPKIVMQKIAMSCWLKNCVRQDLSGVNSDYSSSRGIIVYVK